MRVQGQVSHLIGSMLPGSDQQPKFMQIYFLDHDSQLQRRNHIFSGMEHEILESLGSYFNRYNPFVLQFKQAYEMLTARPTHNLAVKISDGKDIIPGDQHPGRYNRSATNNISVVMTGSDIGPRDIVVQRQSDNSLERINEICDSYEPLQYPIFFPGGNLGYSAGLGTTQKKYYSAKLMVKRGTSRFGPDTTCPFALNSVLLGKRLTQQYILDMGSKIISERLRYLRNNQVRLRASNYRAVRQHLSSGTNGNNNSIGRRIVLPATFHGSPRYMYEKQQDGMAILREIGKPTFLITQTCNPSWPEIEAAIYPGQKSNDRPDIVSRVFSRKNSLFQEMVCKKNVLGKISASVWNMEYQKRCLQHVHGLYWVENDHHVIANIDLYVIAEIPHPDEHPELHQLVVRHMIHGPCGPSCMIDGKCSKGFPKPFRLETEVAENSYPLYRRRSPEMGGHVAVKGRRVVTNQWVVPFNPWLLRQFTCHLNIEICSSVKAIQYILKYCSKGEDRAMFSVEDTVDEIGKWQDGKHLGANEAADIIFSHDRNKVSPNVVKLALHLEGMQPMAFPEDITTEDLQLQSTSGVRTATQLTAFFEICSSCPVAQFLELLYNDAPKFYTWDKTSKTWRRRLRGAVIHRSPELGVIYKADTIARLYSVLPNCGELFYLRMLLINIPLPTSFDDLKDSHPTFHEACRQKNLLDDDTYLQNTMAEAAIVSSSRKLRELLAIIITACSPSNPHALFQEFEDQLCGDYVYMNMNNILTPSIRQRAISEVQDHVERISNGHVNWATLGFPQNQTPIEDPAGQDDPLDRLVNIELASVNATEEREKSELMYTRLNQGQKHIFDELTRQLELHNASTNLYFINADAGTGKTFLLNAILSCVRGQGNIALATASSGSATTVLTGSRTVHKRFACGINVQHQEHPSCDISRSSPTARLIAAAKIIIIDEATLLHRKVYEALDFTFRDIMENDLDFGGKVIIMAGDFKQCLPVIPNGSRGQIIRSTLQRTTFWERVLLFSLTQSMRLDVDTPETWHRQMDELGNGRTNPVCFRDFDGPQTEFPEKSDLIESVFPNFRNALSTSFTQRAILATLNETVDEYNEYVVLNSPGVVITLKSVDSALSNSEGARYPVEFLNTLDPGCLPPHKLNIKTGVPLILIRTINPPILTNGTRCVVIQVHGNHLIEAEITTEGRGPYLGQRVFIPRIPLTNSDGRGVPFKRVQFPAKVAFAITINRSQGQTFDHLGCDFVKPPFTHGLTGNYTWQ